MANLKHTIIIIIVDEMLRINRVFIYFEKGNILWTCLWFDYTNLLQGFDILWILYTKFPWDFVQFP